MRRGSSSWGRGSRASRSPPGGVGDGEGGGGEAGAREVVDADGGGGGVGAIAVVGGAARVEDTDRTRRALCPAAETVGLSTRGDWSRVGDLGGCDSGAAAERAACAGVFEIEVRVVDVVVLIVPRLYVRLEIDGLDGFLLSHAGLPFGQQDVEGASQAGAIDLVADLGREVHEGEDFARVVGVGHGVGAFGDGRFFCLVDHLLECILAVAATAGEGGQLALLTRAQREAAAATATLFHPARAARRRRRGRRGAWRHAWRSLRDSL